MDETTEKREQQRQHRKLLTKRVPNEWTARDKTSEDFSEAAVRRQPRDIRTRSPAIDQGRTLRDCETGKHVGRMGAGKRDHRLLPSGETGVQDASRGKTAKS